MKNYWRFKTEHEFIKEYSKDTSGWTSVAWATPNMNCFLGKRISKRAAFELICGDPNDYFREYIKRKYPKNYDWTFVPEMITNKPK